MSTEREQWLVHAAYLRQLAERAERDGKTGKARQLRLDADEAERKTEAASKEAEAQPS
jgi:hypothetical protein